MNLITLLDHLMHTTPASQEDAQKLNEALVTAHSRVTSLEKDLGKLDKAVSVAETRLRSRGLRVPPRRKDPH
jgi:hypothetical protein